MIGKLFEVYDEAIGLGEHDLACVLQWVITAYAKKHDMPIGVDAFERHVVEAAAGRHHAQLRCVERSPSYSLSGKLGLEPTGFFE